MKKWPFKRGSFHMNSFMKGQEKGDLLIQVSGFLRVLRFPRANKTDRHDVTEILLKVALDTITLTLTHMYSKTYLNQTPIKPLPKPDRI